MAHRNARHTQVLVVGAGPAGLVAGITLARYGVDVLVVDKQSEIRSFLMTEEVENRLASRWPANLVEATNWKVVGDSVLIKKVPMVPLEE